MLSFLFLLFWCGSPKFLLSFTLNKYYRIIKVFNKSYFILSELLSTFLHNNNMYAVAEAWKADMSHAFISRVAFKSCTRRFHANGIRISITRRDVIRSAMELKGSPHHLRPLDILCSRPEIETCPRWKKVDAFPGGRVRTKGGQIIGRVFFLLSVITRTANGGVVVFWMVSKRYWLERAFVCRSDGLCGESK